MASNGCPGVTVRKTLLDVHDTDGTKNPRPFPCGAVYKITAAPMNRSFNT